MGIGALNRTPGVCLLKRYRQKGERKRVSESGGGQCTSGEMSWRVKGGHHAADRRRITKAPRCNCPRYILILVLSLVFRTQI